MMLEYLFEGSKYTFSNKDLKVGDEVYPISEGIVEDGEYFHERVVSENHFEYMINDPHIIENLHHSDYKPYEIRTNHGYGPVEKYFKLIKKEP